MTHDERERPEPRVFHVNDSARPGDAVYIGRRFVQFVGDERIAYPNTLWGNPNLSLSEFRDYARERLEREPNWLDPLRGKHLCCWCKGYRSLRTGKYRKGKPWCHGDVLLSLIREMEQAS